MNEWDGWIHFIRVPGDHIALCGLNLYNLNKRAVWTHREIDITCPKCMKRWEATVEKNEKTLQELYAVDEIRVDLVYEFVTIKPDLADKLSEWIWERTKKTITEENRKIIATLCEHCADGVPLERVLVGKDKIELWVHLFEGGKWVNCEAYKLRQLLSAKEHRDE